MKTETHLHHHDTTRAAIGAIYDVYNKLGFGFQEKYYQRAVAIELTKRGLKFVREQTKPIYYDGRIIGRYYADFIVNDSVILELKIANDVLETYVKQVLGYLHAWQLSVGILAVIRPKEVLIKRLVLDPPKSG